MEVQVRPAHSRVQTHKAHFRPPNSRLVSVRPFGGGLSAIITRVTEMA